MDKETKEISEYIADHCDDLIIMNEYIQLKPINGIYRCKCPFHNERTPSFTVYPKGFKKNNNEIQTHLTYYCFGCSASGNIVTFVHNIEKHDDYEQTFDLFKKRYGISYGEDEKINELNQLINGLKDSSDNNIKSIPEINIYCSSYCREYVFLIKEHYPYLFDKEFAWMQKFYKMLDNSFTTMPAIELQDMYEKVVKTINERKTLLKDKQMF